MSSTITALGIDRMSIDDRLRLVGEIWDSIAAEADALPITDAEKELIDQRLADIEANPDDELDAEEVIARLRGRQ
jgi:putative addiction module component (TIGR02574 family)